MTKVKICGLRRIEDIYAVNRFHPDYAGCILSEGFKRSISLETAGELRRALSPDIPLVGVFVNDSEEKIIDALNHDIIDVAQLHGQESEEMVRRIQDCSGKPVWKVFQIPGERTESQHNQADYEQIERSPAELVLLDAGAGSGQVFDWSLVKPVRRPFILAGGLTPENITEAIAQTQPYMVDTSSGVEIDGWKDNNKIAAFIEHVRRKD